MELGEADRVSTPRGTGTGRGANALRARVIRTLLAASIAVGLAPAGVGSQGVPPTFASAANVIEVEATVLDSNDRPVAGLTKDDFQVFEDGVAQTIDAFSTTSAAPMSVPRDESLSTVAPPVNAAYTGGSYVLILDSGMPERVRLVAREFVEFGVRPGDRVAVVDVRRGVPPVLSLTSDRAAILARIDDVADEWGKWNPSLSSSIPSFRAVRDAAARLAALPGRGKAIVFVGGGTRLLWNDDPKLLELAREIRRMFESAMRMATLANIPVHAVDPSGLAPAMARAALSGATSVIDDPIERLMARQSLGREDQQSSVRLMAEITGGVDIVNTNNLKGNYTRAMRQRGPTYILRYSSPANQRDGRFHAIRVTVSRPNTTVDARQGYYAFRPGGSVAPAASFPRGLSAGARDALEDDVPLAGIGITVAAAVFSRGGPGSSVLVGIDIDVGRAPVNRSRPVELAWAAVDEDGAIRTVARAIIEPRDMSRDTAVVTVFKRLALVPGRYRIAVAAVQEDGPVGSASTWVDGGSYLGGGLLFSDIVLASSTRESRHVVSPDEPIRKVLAAMPTQRRTFERDVTLQAFVEVENRGQFVEKGLTLRAQLKSPAGDTVWTHRQTVPSSANILRIEYKATIPLNTLRADDYLLVIDASDASGAVIAEGRPLAIRVN